MTANLGFEIQQARRKIVREGLDMSIGEIASLYEQGEFIISPPYQRLFRWEEQQKTRFIESIFLNVPIPPIFVYTKPDGKWELVDGLQRVSTCLQFMRKLVLNGDLAKERLVCAGTNLVPGLADVFWPSSAEGNHHNALPIDLQLNFRRAKIRVEVLGPDTDTDVRFELFQRLNSGGTNLSEQEVRNCVIFSVSPAAYDALRSIAEDANLLACYEPTDRQKEEQYVTELVLRLVCLRHVPYDGKKDVHEYLSSAIVEICGNPAFNWEHESAIIRRTFDFIRTHAGDKAFWKGNRRSLGLYEFASLATSRLLELRNGGADPGEFRRRYDKLLKDRDLERYSKAGVSGTDRWRHFVAKRGYDYFTR